jgi:glycerophosphoryl diester phosphodiesterase
VPTGTLRIVATDPFAFLDQAGPVAFAHRGGGKERPENTWASFSHARDLGYRYLETDVHATADGVVAVIHDPFLDRVTDRSGVVETLPWSTLADARIDGTERIPRLDELLAEWPEIRWNIDAKHEAVVEPLLDVLRAADALERVCVTSFSDARIERIRAAAGPKLCTSTGPRAIAALRLASVAPWAASVIDRWGAAGATQVPVRWGALPVIDRRFIDFAHRRGIAVHAWTIDDEAAMVRLLDTGVDGIMTDRPTLLRNVLRRRGQWTQPD